MGAEISRLNRCRHPEVDSKLQCNTGNKVRRHVRLAAASDSSKARTTHGFVILDGLWMPANRGRSEKETEGFAGETRNRPT